jgi:RNA polymerase sigma-B factor
MLMRNTSPSGIERRRGIGVLTALSGGEATPMAPLAAPPQHRPTRKDLADLLERYHRERDPRDRDALVERMLPLARHLAHRYGSGSEREDVEQVANLALVKAIDRFDPGRGIAFTSFAVPTILGEIKRYFRDQGWAVHVPRSLRELAARVEIAVDDLNGELGRSPTTEEIAQRCDTTVERVVEARMTLSAHRPDSLDRPQFEEDGEPHGAAIPCEDPGFARVESATDVDRLLGTLPERERLIVRMRFQEDMLQRDIAERVGVSQMHVSRLLREAIEQLQEHAGAA